MTKAEIVDAAFKVWGRNFYQKTSLSQLARELGVSKPALYRHFSNKQSLTEAMTERFFDDFTAFILADYKLAMQEKAPNEAIYAVLRSVALFYAENVHAFIYSLINIYNRNPGADTTGAMLRSRGLDLEALHQIFKNKYTSARTKADSRLLMNTVFATLSFFMAQFHKSVKSFDNDPSEEVTQRVVTVICKKIEYGLGYGTDVIAPLNFAALEKQIDSTFGNTEPEPLFRAVAEAVAEAGPWGASMEMVAQRLGLSKSSLYGHFKNRKDMIRRLFIGEFKRILDFARQGIGLSPKPAEQLYLGIFSIAVYLRSRSEILTALDWLRTRKLDIGKSEKEMEEYFKLFVDIEIEPIMICEEIEKQHVSHWILFLIINTLIRFGKEGSVKNTDIRSLFRFITLGLRGFKQL